MALNKGDSNCSTGLSKRLYDYWTADTVGSGFGVANEAALSASQRAILKAQCWAFAQGIVDEIVANGKAYIGTGLGALQQASGVDTTAPTAEREIPLR